MKKHRGLFRPKFRDSVTRQIKESQIWWMDYFCKGCQKHPEGGRHRESSETEKVTDAQRELDKRRGMVAEGKPLVNVNQIMLSQLLKGVEDHSLIHNKETSHLDLKDKMKNHIDPFFAGYRAIDLCLDDSIVRKFIAKKKTDGYAPSSINGMLNVISRAFTLAKNRIHLRPIIEKLPVDNCRKIFFSETDFFSLCKHLPDDVRRVAQIAYITGWRISEILSRGRRHVDWDEKEGKLILEAGQTKNGKGRFFPLISQLRTILEEQEEATKALEKEKGMLIPWLFHRNGWPFAKEYPRGWKPTRDFQEAWKAAIEAAKLVGRIRHDFRRTAIRNFEKFGISDEVGMKLSGHLTYSVYQRYKSIGDEDLFEAAAKMEKGQSQIRSRNLRQSNVKVKGL